MRTREHQREPLIGNVTAGAGGLQPFRHNVQFVRRGLIAVLPAGGVNGLAPRHGKQPTLGILWAAVPWPVS
jgi:hypothetical protein